MEKLIKFLTIILLIAVTAGVIVQWIAIKEYNSQLVTFKREQDFFSMKLKDLRKDLDKADLQLRTSMRDLANLTRNPYNARTVDKQISDRIEKLSNIFKEWQLIWNEMAAKIDRLDQKAEYPPTGQVKKVELGELSVQKNIDVSAKESTE